MNPREYPGATRDALVEELAAEVEYLSIKHATLARDLADHQRTYWQAYERSDGASVSARQQDAAHASLALWADVLEQRGEINATAVKIDLLRLLLGSDLRVSQRDTFPPDKVLVP